MRQKQIAAAIRRDLLRDDDDKISDAIKCFSCGRGMTSRMSTQFCCERCRAWCDDGNPGHAQDWRQPRTSFGVARWKVIAGPATLEVGSDPHAAFKPRDRHRGEIGVWIECAHCRKSFDSRGLRCCSLECERRYSEHQDNLRLMTEVGINPAAKRRCQCGAVIPKWRNGRRVRCTTQFCCDDCARKARREAAQKIP